MTDLREQATDLIDQAQKIFGHDNTVLTDVRARMDEPLRVAIAGKVKAGKSTLLNALVGEKLAPTDTGECTRIVTWYRNGHTYLVELFPDGAGSPEQARFHRADGAIEVDLSGRAAESFQRMEVTWPSSSLRALTLIDTPGVGSLSDGVAERSFEFLSPEETETPADAVLYLMKHIHASDLRLLEAFHDTTVSQPNPVNAMAVLSRADEIGGGRLDAMTSARRIADRYGDDARLRRLVQVVVPVSGLLAETSRTLTQAEFRWLATLATMEAERLEMPLLSADRFVSPDADVPLGEVERVALLERLGLFGVRLAVSLLRRGVATTSTELAEQLVGRSGLTDLQRLLSTLFMDRADVLKARSAVLAVERLCENHPDRVGVPELEADIERMLAGAHPFRELASLAAVRSGRVRGKTAELRDLERILGANGTAATDRLGLEPGADEAAIRQAILESLTRWQRRAENPLTGHDLAQAARVAIRTLEGLLAA